MLTAGFDGVKTGVKNWWFTPFQSSRQPVYIQIPNTFGLNPHSLIGPIMNQLVYILGNAHMALGLTMFRRGKLNTPLK